MQQMLVLVWGSRMNKILLVDDDPVFLEYVKILLKKCDIICAANPVQALKKLNDVKLVITDICMPQMNGINFIENLKKAYSDVPVIAVTGYIHNVDAAKAAGANECFTKPFGEAEIDLICEKYSL